mgnify:CR=1 FL=1
MIKRHFATVNGRWGTRQVHYRRAGRGPALLMLHQSPQSSANLIPLIKAWQKHFTIIAPDTPGYGCSDPLTMPDASIEDFAAAVLEFMDTLGLQRVGVYGYHTGGSIAVALAQIASDRITACAVNGLASLTGQERKDILDHYLPPVRVRWDGSHLTWLWSRMRDQHTFFPWFRRTAAARLDAEMPPPALMHNALVELLRAGEHYQVAYRAAFNFTAGAALKDTNVPTLVTAAAHDPLLTHLSRIASPAACVELKASADADAAADACLHLLLRARSEVPPAAADTMPIEGRLWQKMVDVEGGQLRVKCNFDANGRPLVFQHDAGGSTDTVEEVARSLIGQRSLVLVDFPGHGESDKTLDESEVTVPQHRNALAEALSNLGMDQIDYYGIGSGALVGLDLAVTAPERVHRLAMTNILFADERVVADLKANYAPEWTPDWYGGHLLQCWYLARDQLLFWPWYQRKRANIIRNADCLSSHSIHQHVLEMLKAPGMWRRSHQAYFDYPTDSMLASVGVPTALCATNQGHHLSHARKARAAHQHCSFLALPDMPAERGAAIHRLLCSNS